MVLSTSIDKENVEDNRKLEAHTHTTNTQTHILEINLLKRRHY